MSGDEKLVLAEHPSKIQLPQGIGNHECFKADNQQPTTKIVGLAALADQPYDQHHSLHNEDSSVISWTNFCGGTFFGLRCLLAVERLAFRRRLFP